MMINGKTMLAVLLLALSAGFAQAIGVGTTPIKILPKRNVRLVEMWEAGKMVEQGSVLKHGYNYFMALNAGVLGDTPPSFNSGSELNGGVTLVYAPRGPRKGFAIQVHGEGRVWVRASRAPEINQKRGVLVTGDLSHWSESGSGCPQGAIWVVAESTGTQISIMEW